MGKNTYYCIGVLAIVFVGLLLLGVFPLFGSETTAEFDGIFYDENGEVVYNSQTQSYYYGETKVVTFKIVLTVEMIPDGEFGAGIVEGTVYLRIIRNSIAGGVLKEWEYSVTFMFNPGEPLTETAEWGPFSIASMIDEADAMQYKDEGWAFEVEGDLTADASVDGKTYTDTANPKASWKIDWDTGFELGASVGNPFQSYP